MSQGCTLGGFLVIAGADATNRRAVGGSGDTDSVRLWRGPGRVLLRRRDAQPRHRHDHPPPAGGLTPYRRAVELALTRTSAEVNAAGADVAAGLLPNDPEWAGEVVYTDTRSRPFRLAPTALACGRSRRGQ